MSQFFEIHPDNPQLRLIKQAAQIIHKGGLVALPTDSCYALVCQLDNKDAVERVRRIRGVDDKHHLTLLCRDLSEIAQYAKVDNRQYRLLKAATPGAYTFIWKPPRKCRAGSRILRARPSACACRRTASPTCCWKSWVNRSWAPR